ncbi:MAG: phosphatidylinositol kinase [Rhizobacter sp.]|nr:phosphatidylinositol kinase [Rhizobacter sp.]
MSSNLTARHRLASWAGAHKVATVGFEPSDDRWTLQYEPEWVADRGSFPLSPALALKTPDGGYAPGAVRRFIANLLPEGRALDITARTYGVSTSNVFGLINALGVETAGAFRFLPESDDAPPARATASREVTLAELSDRLAQRNDIPFVVWDGRVRMSIAGYQDKLLVYADGSPVAGARMFLVEPPLASTHILKPQPARGGMPHLVVNEHFCMSLAARMGLPVAHVGILRVPDPVLVVERFDRRVGHGENGPAVKRLHIIDACQASDMPVDHKYERNLGNSEVLRHYRDGVSFEVLFDRVAQTSNKAAARLVMLRWALFQFLIGNSDAHGKNFSFFVQPHGLSPTPWYDLVSVVQYPDIDHEMAMGFGNAFKLEEVGAFQMADFARRCGLERRMLRREGANLARLAIREAATQARSPDYLDKEREFIDRLQAFVIAQATRLDTLVTGAILVDNADL